MRHLAAFLLLLVCARGWAAEADRDDFDKYLQGRFVFKSQCVPCHGTTGRGNGPWAKGMPVQPRNFRMGIYKYRSTPMGFQPTDDDLRRTITRGVSGTAMPTFAKTLSDRDLTAVIVYLKNLSSRWKDDLRKTNAFTLPEEPKWLYQEKDLQAHAKKGRVLFDQICISCHGPNGAGDGTGAVGLTNVWGQVAIPANLGVKHHRSGPTRTDLYRTISMGLDGTPMIGFRDALKEEQIWELIAAIEQFARP